MSKTIMKQTFSGILSFLLLATSAFASELDATLHWADEQYYSFAVNGRVDRVLVAPGEKLQQGALLAALDRRPFDYAVSKCKAAINKIEPAIFDAKIELDQAEELYERTVLSELELQKVEVIYKTLVAEREMAQAECELQQWQAEQAELKAREASYVLASNIYPGLVVSEENKSAAVIQLASATKASALAYLDTQLVMQYAVGQSVEVRIGDETLQGRVQSIALQADEKGRHPLRVIFDYSRPVIAGTALRLKF
jgi:multidrug efflux system membrane fusion protein